MKGRIVWASRFPASILPSAFIGQDVSDWMRRASLQAFAVLRERDPVKLYERITAETRELLEALAVRALSTGSLPGSHLLGEEE